MRRPILYSFRRCPYAMRARLALQSAKIECEFREIVLRDKAPEFVAASAKATVPVMVLPDGRVLEESFDIMLWALGENDPEGWLRPAGPSVEAATALVAEADGEFKTNLDHYKYASRYDADKSQDARDDALVFLEKIDLMLANDDNLSGSRAGLADFAIAPFVRQFANVDRDWFDQQPLPNLHRWLQEFLTSTRFGGIMTKYPKWQNGAAVTVFPAES